MPAHVSLRARLIDLMEMEECIWYKGAPDYGRRDRVESAWERIQQDLECLGHRTNVAELKNMWKNLKDTYRRKNNPTTGSASGPQWTYLQAMRFLERNQHDGFDGHHAGKSAWSAKSRQSQPKVQATIERVDEHLQRSRHQQHPTVDSFQGFGDFVAQHLRERFDAYTADVKMRQMLEVLFSYTYCSQGNEGVVHEEYVGEYPQTD
ncbi:hypothetical protein OSTOST_17049 [Ostertagia ostertagi]